MSIATKTPPIRIRRAQPCLGSAPATMPKPKGPAKPPKPPSPGPAPVQPAAASKPKGPVRTPPKPRPPLVKVDNPRRLRIRSKEHRKLGGFVVCSPAWGSPFRPREIDGRWFVAWTGDEMRLERHKPDGWRDVPCKDRREAAELALLAFEDWITSPASAGLLDHARTILRGYNLVCFCPPGWPCHGDTLLKLLNQQSEEPRLV